MQRWLQSQLLQLAAPTVVGGARSGWPSACRHLDTLRGFASGNPNAGQLKPEEPRAVDGKVAVEAQVEFKPSSGGSSTTSPLELLQRFRSTHRPTPPVSFIKGMPAPTALSWLRRRGPQVPHTVLHRLFRQRQIRLFDGTRVVRVRPCRALRNGDLLLVPANLRSPAAAAASGHYDGDDDYDEQEGGGGGAPRRASHAAAGPGPGSSSRDRPTLFASQQHGLEGPSIEAGAGRSANTSAAAGAGAAPGVLTAERVRRWVLGVYPGLFFINKPAGVRVHGRAAGDADGSGAAAGAGGGPSLDSVMRRSLRFGELDEPKLVHRLDAQASGVMVVARNADAAAWLAAAFSGKARQALEEEEEEDDGRGRGRQRSGGRGRAGEHEEDSAGPSELFVRRTYWAFLAGDLQPRQTGRIRFPVLVDGVFQPAVSAYRVKATGCGVSWVELTPETGRRHQLRVHCARKLGAPIIGDARYGYRGLPPRLALRDRLPPEWWALLGEDPRVVSARSSSSRLLLPASAVAPPVLLHARELVVKRPGKAALTAVAPLPRYMRQLIEAAGWSMPNDG